jgi:hypothetical protein
VDPPHSAADLQTYVTLLEDAAAQSDRQILDGHAFDRQAKVQLINGRSISKAAGPVHAC